MERQGGKVRKLVGVSKKLFQSAEKERRAASRLQSLSCKKLREVWGRKREGPWKQTDQIGQLVQKFIWQVRDSSVPLSNHRLRWAVDGMRFTAPLPV